MLHVIPWRYLYVTYGTKRRKNASENEGGEYASAEIGFTAKISAHFNTLKEQKYRQILIP